MNVSSIECEGELGLKREWRECVPGTKLVCKIGSKCDLKTSLQSELV
jgi:hypothetical protein